MDTSKPGAGLRRRSEDVLMLLFLMTGQIKKILLETFPSSKKEDSSSL